MQVFLPSEAAHFPSALYVCICFVALVTLSVRVHVAVLCTVYFIVLACFSVSHVQYALTIGEDPLHVLVLDGSQLSDHP